MLNKVLKEFDNVWKLTQSPMELTGLPMELTSNMPLNQEQYFVRYHF